MLDIKYIRDNVEALRRGARDKRVNFDLDGLLALDREIKPLQAEWETLQAERNSLSKTIGAASAEAREPLKAKVQVIKERMDGLTESLKDKKARLEQLMLLVPQPARADVPVGKDDTENVEVRRVGTVPTFDFKIKDHAEIGKKLGIIDTERGVKIAGSRSYVLRGDGARLEQAVLRFTYDLLIERGYTPMSIPVLVTEECMIGTGYFPQGKDQAYWVGEDKLALVGTSEVSLTSFHAHEMLKDTDLPIRMMAWSSCFRREAGTYGKDTQGLYRVHQFTKIEQVIVGPNDPAASEKFHDELLGNAEDVLKAFGLPFRVVYVCTGDLGQGQIRKHDIETWMPSRNSYSETHSCSTFHEFQTRRLDLRYKDAKGDKFFAHTLNNTAIATPRVLIPLLENFQEKDGRVRIPEVLRSYMGGKTHIG